MPVVVRSRGPMLSSGPSKVISPTDHTWLGIQKRLFLWKERTSTTKALLLEGTKISYQNPSLRRYNYFLQKSFSQKAQLLYIKALLMKGNIIHNFTTTKRALSRGNSFKCMIREASLTNPYTQLDILSLLLVAPIFSLQS